MRRLVVLLSAVLLLPAFTTAGPTSAPEIDALSVDRDRLAGGAEVVVEGRNFSDGMLVVLGDAAVTDYTVESATRLRFQVPPQRFAGGRTLTIQTTAGVAQRVFHILAPGLGELSRGDITTIGGGVHALGDGNPATSADVALFPTGVAVDRDGNVFVSDALGNRVRRVDAVTGQITTYVGTGAKAYDGDGGPALLASLNDPYGLAFDRNGDLLIADSGNRRIRRVDAVTGIVSTIPSKLSYAPIDLEVDENGVLYASTFAVSDTFSADLVRIDLATGDEMRVDLGPEFVPSFIGLGREADGHIALSLPNYQRLVRYDPTTGEVSHVAQLTDNGYYSDVMVDRDGTWLLRSASISRVVRFDPETETTTPVAGSGEIGFGGDGGPATEARLASPIAFAMGDSGNLYIADVDNGRIRVVDTTGTIATVAGSGQFVALGDGWPATSTRLFVFTNYLQESITVDAAGNVFVSDVARVRRIDAATGTITTVAGKGEIGFGGDDGPATEASLARPHGLALDGDGNLFIADSENRRIRRIDAATGIITTIAETPRGRLFDLVLDRAGRLYATDYDDPVLLRVNVDTGAVRTVATLARTWVSPYMTVDRSGTVYVSLYGKIVRVSAAGASVKTVAGTGLPGNPDENQKARRARVTPFGLAVDRAGNLLFANWYAFQPPDDDFDATIRRINAKRKDVFTLAGRLGRSWDFDGDGQPALGAGFLPTDIALDGAGNLYIADPWNGRIRVVKEAGRP